MKDHAANTSLNPPGGEFKHVMVVGAGATGSLIALELAKRGHHVTLIDSGAPGNGSSSRSAACIRQQFDTPSTVRGMRFARSYYDAWAEHVGGAESPIRHCGYLFLYDLRSDPTVVQNKVEMQRSAGLHDVEFLGYGSLHERFPYLTPEILRFATWCPTDGFLRPELVYGDAVERLRTLPNAKVWLHTHVVGSLRTANGIVTHLSVRTKSGGVEQVAVDVVVNATNAWTNTLCQQLGLMTLPIIARQRLLLHLPLNAATSYLSHSPMIIGPNGCYTRPTNDGGLTAGWLHHVEGQQFPSYEGQDDVPRDLQARYSAWVREEATHMLPGVSDLPAKSTVTSGYYADTPDHNPIIDWDTQSPNVLHAAGFSGHGLMHAPFTAQIVCQLVAAGTSLSEIDLPGFGSVDIAPYHANREFIGGEGMVI